MSTNMLPSCSLQLAPETLSAWRDSALEAREARRISSHIDTCIACQAQLGQFEQIATALRNEHVPLPPQALWPGLRERLDRLDTSVALPPHRQRRPAIARIGGALAVLAAVLVVAIVHFSVASQPSGVTITIQAGPTPTAGPAPTVAPAQQLTWKALAFPANRESSPFIPIFAPGDANTVYACQENYEDPSAAFAIWATHDGGASWSLVGHLPAQPLGSPLVGHLPVYPLGSCRLAVDATQSQALVATVDPPLVQGTCSGPQCTSPSYLSTDGGKTWTSIGTGREYTQLATYKDLTYAVVHEPKSGSTSYMTYTSHLAVSSDLRSWQNIDQPILHGGASVSGLYLYDGVQRFWLNPTNGSLLAVTSLGGVGGAERLWESGDGGHAWQEITPTAFQPQAVAVQPPAAGQSWHICVTNWSVYSGVSQITGDNLLACTTDGGRMWVSRPALNIPWSYAGTTTVHPLFIITIGADGSLIAAVSQSNLPGQGDHLNLYRLTPFGSTWQPLGPDPDPNNSGTFQEYPSGAIVFNQSYIATYP